MRRRRTVATLLAAVIVPVLGMAAPAIPLAAASTPPTYVAPNVLAVHVSNIYADRGAVVPVTISGAAGAPAVCATATSSTLTVDFTIPRVPRIVTHPSVATMATKPFLITVPPDANFYNPEDRITLTYECDGVTDPAAPSPDLATYPVVITVGGPSVGWSTTPPRGPFSVDLHTGVCVGPVVNGQPLVKPMISISPVGEPSLAITKPEAAGTPLGVHTMSLPAIPASWPLGFAAVTLSCTIPELPHDVHDSYGPVEVDLVPIGGPPTSLSTTPTTAATTTSVPTSAPVTNTSPVAPAAAPVAATSTFTG